MVRKLLDVNHPSTTCDRGKTFLTNGPQSVKCGSYLSTVLAFSKAEPTTLRPVYICLHYHTSHQLHHQIHGWYHCGQAHIRRRWISLQRWKYRRDHSPLFINGDCVERVQSIKYLGYTSLRTSSGPLTPWCVQRRHSNNSTFWEHSGKTSWIRSCWWPIIAPPLKASWCTAAQCGMPGAQLQTEEPSGGSLTRLPSLEDITKSRRLSRPQNIPTDSAHPTHHLFDLLPSDRCYRSIKTHITTLKVRFFPWAIRSLSTSK